MHRHATEMTGSWPCCSRTAARRIRDAAIESLVVQECTGAVCALVHASAGECRAAIRRCDQTSVRAAALVPVPGSCGWKRFVGRLLLLFSRRSLLLLVVALRRRSSSSSCSCFPSSSCPVAGPAALVSPSSSCVPSSPSLPHLMPIPTPVSLTLSSAPASEPSYAPASLLTI